MKIFWFSFSYKGKNNGVCVLQAGNKSEASVKILDFQPDYDDVFCCELKITTLAEEHPKLEFNKLYTPEDMIALGYASQKTHKHS